MNKHTLEVGYGSVEKVTSLFDLVTDLGKVEKPERRTMFFNEVFKRYAMKCEHVISKIKAFLWEVIGLINEIEIGILHLQSNS